MNGDSLYGYWQTSYINYAPDFGNGITYTVGTDNYATKWNYSMMNANTWKVNFTLPKAPTAGTQGRFYLALASSYGSNLTISVNGTQVGRFAPGNPSDAVVRLGSQGAFWDTSLLFNATLLKAGANTLSISQSGGTLEWDYLRLEANGTGAVGVINEASSSPVRLPAISLRGAALAGDGVHGLDVIGLDGRMLGHAIAGQTLDLSRFPHGTYIVRCGAEVFSVAWTR